jgi:hypothetical protein
MQGEPPPIEQKRLGPGAPHAYFAKCRERKLYDEITEFLQHKVCTDSIFQDCVESTLGLRVITPVMCPIKEGIVWFGVKLTWALRDQAAEQNRVFGAVLHSIAPVHELKSWPEVAACDASLPVDRPRVGWLILCLLNPTLVGRLAIARR